MCAASSSILERLRADTRTVHDRLETTIPLLNPLATERTYATYLAALLGFHRPIEQALRSVHGLSELPLEVEQRWKSSHLAADLESCASCSVAAVPDCDRTPAVDDLPDALGCLYVLDGATLGGRVIHRHLATRFPETMTHAARYLQIYGTSTRLRWDQLCAVLAARPRAEHEVIAVAARRTFHAFADWVDAYAVPRWRAEGLPA